MPDLTAAEVFRDFVTDGVPSSGANKPKKADIRTLLTGYEEVDAFIQDALGEKANTEDVASALALKADASALPGLQRAVAGASVTLTGKTIGTGGKLWDVPARCRRICFRVTGAQIGAGENWGFRMYNPTEGLIVSGYGGGHSRFASGATSISTSSSFWVVCGSTLATESYGGVVEMFRTNDPAHAWSISAQLYDTSGANVLRHAAGSKHSVNELTEIHLHGAGTFAGGSIIPIFFVDV